MGHRDKNFHNDMMVRRGYPEAAAEDPGALPGGPQARGDRGRPRRVLRRVRAGRARRSASATATRSGRALGRHRPDLFRVQAAGGDGTDGRSLGKPRPNRLALPCSNSLLPTGGKYGGPHCGAGAVEKRRTGHVRILTLNRPAKKNALSGDLIAGAHQRRLRVGRGRRRYYPGGRTDRRR